MNHASFFWRTTLFALALVSVGSLAATNEERPRLQNYPSYYQFLKAMEAWNQAHAEAQNSPAPSLSEPTPPPTIEIPAPVANIDPTSEFAPPPFIVHGPEDLDVAVELARHIEHPDYKEKVRYNRSTHISFPLESIDGNDMSTASVGDALSLGTVTGGSQSLSASQLSSLLEQEGGRPLDSRNDKDLSRTPGAGMQLAPVENRSQISVSSH